MVRNQFASQTCGSNRRLTYEQADQLLSPIKLLVPMTFLMTGLAWMVVRSLETMFSREMKVECLELLIKC